MRCCIAGALTTLVLAGQAIAEYPASWDVIFTPATPPPVNYTFGQQTKILNQNTTFPPAALPLPCDIVYDRGVSITLRDGTVIYTDVFRPVPDGQYPALIALSAYGKTVPTLPQVDVPADWFSGIAKNESADAAAFVCRVYVVVSPDNRRAGKSEENIHYWGRVDAEDGYDVIEWTAQQPWSSGKTALHGASWLATSQ
ncbi:hypothetical protein DTO164E3_4279 [Paecilomyces variotii]|nr:hypothetical protein DTO032I3_6126 [Paecilomyces variotii]KAJ9200268.1 hypothetical protein DTO164E3_4279 [Paecilomyces variotii]KAJ9281796.1 hypothetical protein DTO021D3_1092 [Paecilomyces variotii]KAJ9347256.1 hypothetical protein DTO027B6_130 [Paecilomyces variotii]KAJ9388729.1 hypothetical protein DTO032I4_2699 [Paecilomyces variotii]